MPVLLHVGCGPLTKARTTPGFNQPEWTEVRLDIDPTVAPDIIGTMTDMSGVPDGAVDAVFSSHNLEHLYIHEVPQALAEFRRVLKPDGFAVITCPDLQALGARLTEGKLTEPIYDAGIGAVSAHDILYGYGGKMAQGNLFMAHRCGFTLRSLIAAIDTAGFARSFGVRRAAFFDLWALASRGRRDLDGLRQLASDHFPPRGLQPDGLRD